MNDILKYITYSDGIIRGFIPSVVLINFILLLFCIAANIKQIARALSGINVKTWLLLTAVFVIAVLLRLHASHRHVLFVDEFMYMEAGKNILLHHTQFNYPESIGWPFVLSMFFSVFGVDNHVAIYTAVFFGSLSVFAVFMLVYIISNNAGQGLFSAFVYSLMPANIMWSGTASQGSASQFHIIMTMFFCFLYYKKNTYPLLLLACVSLAFTANFRQENYFYPLLFISGFFIYGIRVPRGKVLRFVIPFLLLAILSSPNLISVLNITLHVNWIESDTRGARTGDNWSYSNFTGNLRKQGLGIISGKYHPLLYSLLFLTGGVFMARNRRKDFLFLAFWLGSLIIIYFTSWLQTLSGRSRFFMYMVPVTIIFASFGIIWIHQFLVSKLGRGKAGAALAAFTAVLPFAFAPYISSFSKHYSDDTHFLMTSVIERAEKDVPKNCRIAANAPVILKSTTELNVVDAEMFLDSETYRDEAGGRNKCLLFFEDNFCHTWDWDNSFEKCCFFFDRFELEPFSSYSSGDETFRFWKITGENKHRPGKDFRIVNSTPGQGEKGLARNPSEYVFYFNKPVDGDSLKKKHLDFENMYFSLRYSSNNNVLIMRVDCYDSFLEENRKYRIAFSDRIRSVDGISLAPFELIFQTGGTVNPDGPPEIGPEDKRYERKCR